jgi:hypothetical protein
MRLVQLLLLTASLCSCAARPFRSYEDDYVPRRLKRAPQVVAVSEVPNGFKTVGEITPITTETDLQFLYREAARVGQDVGCDAVFNVPLRNDGFFGVGYSGRASFAAAAEGRFLCAIDLDPKPLTRR